MLAYHEGTAAAVAHATTQQPRRAWIGSVVDELVVGFDLSLPVEHDEVETDGIHLSGGEGYHLPVEPHRVVVPVGIGDGAEGMHPRLDPFLVGGGDPHLQVRMAVDLL
jgi:hypothetical protein